MQLDASVVEEFLAFFQKSVPEDAVLGFTAIKPNDIKNFFYIASDSPKEIAKRVVKLAESGYNTYIRCSVLRSIPNKGRGTKAVTYGTSFLYADIDSKSDATLKKIQGFLKPTILVDSGHGYHVWYKIKGFVEDIDEIEARNAWISQRLNGDKCYDAARVLRIPGTLNWKNPENPLPVKAVEFNADVEYSLDTFDKVEIVEANKVTPIVPEPLPHDFLTQVKEKDETLYSRIVSEDAAVHAGAPTLPSGRIDRSRNDIWVAVKLLSNGFTKGQVLSVLTHPQWVTGEKYKKTHNITYALRTIAAAEKFLSESVEKKKALTQFFRVSARGTLQFVPKKMGDYLMSKHPVITIGGQFYIYFHGVYKRDTSDLIRREIVQLLGEEWSSHRENEVIAYLRSSTAVAPDDIQTKYINVKNGLLDPITRELHTHTPRYKSITQLPVIYDVTADASPAVDFVSSIVPRETVSTVFEFLAFTLMPGYRYKKILFLVGESNTGKSTLLNWMRAFLGAQNVSSVPLRALVTDKFASASLYGKLANIYADLDALPLSSVAQIKSLSGGDAIEAQYKFEKPFTFVNSAKLIFSANEFPAIPGGDAAFYKRFLVIPCTNVFRFKDNANPFVLEKYTTPEVLSGALNLVLDAYRTLVQRGGFNDDAEALKRGLHMFEAATNSVITFIADDTIADASAMYTKQQFYMLYRQWCVSTGHSPLSMTRFYRTLKSYLDSFKMRYKYLRDDDGVQRWYVVGRRVISAPKVLSDGRISTTV